METPMITASRSVSRRGAKRFCVEISKIGGGEVVARGLARVLRCGCTQGPWCPGARVKDIWADRVLGALGPGLVSISLRGFQHGSPLAQLGLPCSRTQICFSTASSLSCTECSLNVSSPQKPGNEMPCRQDNDPVGELKCSVSGQQALRAESPDLFPMRDEGLLHYLPYKNLDVCEDSRLSHRTCGVRSAQGGQSERPLSVKTGVLLCVWKIRKRPNRGAKHLGIHYAISAC